MIQVLLAMYVMEELEQRRFRSDPGFRFQLVRRVRALADVNAGTRYDYKSNKVRRVYREMSPRAVAMIGQWLADTLGGAGARLAKMEREDQERQDRERSQASVSSSRTSSERTSPTTTHGRLQRRSLRRSGSPGSTNGEALVAWLCAAW